MSTEVTTKLVTAEAELVARVRAGDAAAEEALVTRYRRAVVVIATARTRDPEAARDLAQEVLMAVLLAVRAGQVREADKLAAFVQGTARNLINNYLRARARRAETDLDDVDPPAGDPVIGMEEAERRRLLQREVSALNAVDQKILLWSLVDGHSLAEVAKRLEMSHDAVRARKSRAVRRITEKMTRVSQE